MSRRPRAGVPEIPLVGGIPAESALGQLLADASAPAHPHELEGLSAALTAFNATRPGLRRSRMKTVLAKLLAIKALAAAGAVGLGGVALAAATGALPPSAQNTAHDLFGAPAASSPSPADSPDATPTPQADPTSAPASAAPAPAPSETPSPSLTGLCHAYQAGVATAPGKALDNPAFTVLITAAGGKDGVSSYCSTLLASAPGGRPTSLPSAALNHRPAGHPTGAPTAHPTGAPVTHPNGAPASHPTGGAPTTHPNGAPGAHPTGRP